MRIGTWNILHATNLKRLRSDNLALQDFAREIKEAEFDFLALQEVDEGQERSGNLPQMRNLSELTNMPYWVFARTVVGIPGVSWRKADTSETLVTHADYELRAPMKSYGVGVLSKIPIEGIISLNLGRSPFGLPLIVATTDKGRPRFAYIKDEPRIAVGVVLSNGWTIINTHLSFVPLLNYFQLLKIKRWSKIFGEKIIITGDFNLPAKLPTRFSKWRELHFSKTYPSWKPGIKFDHIITNTNVVATPIELSVKNLSDHLPIMIEVN